MSWLLIVLLLDWQGVTLTSARFVHYMRYTLLYPSPFDSLAASFFFSYRFSPHFFCVLQNSFQTCYPLQSPFSFFFFFLFLSFPSKSPILANDQNFDNIRYIYSFSRLHTPDLDTYVGGADPLYSLFSFRSLINIHFQFTRDTRYFFSMQHVYKSLMRFVIRSLAACTEYGQNMHM